MSSGIALADSAMQGIVARGLVGAQAAQHLVAVDVGQLHVHQDQVGPLSQRLVHAAEAVAGGVQLQVRALGQQFLHDQQVHRVVLDVEQPATLPAARGAGSGAAPRDGCAGSSASRCAPSGSRTSNTLPWPGVLCERTVPPMRSTSDLTIARPMPVPSMPSLLQPEPVEGLEGLLQLGLAHAAAGVADAQQHRGVQRFGLDQHLCRRGGCT